MSNYGENDNKQHFSGLPGHPAEKCKNRESYLIGEMKYIFKDTDPGSSEANELQQLSYSRRQE